MSHRIAKFASAIFACLLAGIALPTVAHSAVEPAESCLSGPKGAPPKGGHWYYRVDRATKRQCWYVGDAKEKPSRANPQDPSPSKEQQQSVADARAELSMPQTPVEQESGATAISAQRTPASIEIGQRTEVEHASPQRSVVASRWPESSGASASAGPGPAIGPSLANGPTNSEAPPPPALAPVTLAPVTLAAANSSTEKPSGSIQTLLLVVIGALTLAGLMGSAIYRLGAVRWKGRREIGIDRRAIWDLADRDRRSPAAGAADHARRRIAAMIARLSQTTTA